MKENVGGLVLVTLYAAAQSDMKAYNTYERVHSVDKNDTPEAKANKRRVEFVKKRLRWYHGQVAGNSP